MKALYAGAQKDGPAESCRMLGDAADYQPSPISGDGVAAVGGSGNFGSKAASRA